MKKIFVLTIALGFLASCGNNSSSDEVAAASSPETATKKEMDNKQLRHVVLFKFKEGTTEEEIKKVEEAFTTLPGKIPEIRDFEWGTNNSPEGLDKGFTHCFFLTFNSEEDRAAYLPHPDHKAFGEVIGPYIEDVLVVDYWTKK